MQSTQSTGTLFFRAVVMLGFLGVIFYAAVSGNALPDAARKQIEKFLPQALVANKSAPPGNPSAASANGDAPPFNIAGAGNTAMSVDAAPRKLATDGSAMLLPTPPANGAPLALANNNPAPVVPVNYQTPAESLPAAISSAASNPLSQMQDRLRQLGATYYLLETWGNEQQFYRFYCKMAVGGNTNYTHCFESTNADSLQAMADVLKQVEAWRNGESMAR